MSVVTPAPAPAIAIAIQPTAFAAQVRSWIAAHSDALEPFRPQPYLDLASHVDRLRPFHRMLHAAGLARAGWPVELGGLGGPPLLRGILYDELSAAGYELPRGFEFIEIILPMLQAYAPDLAARHLDGLTNGDTLLCQGFSEPEAGSDLGALRTRAAPAGDDWLLTGQKTWIGNGHVADWCLLLARTGDRASGHRGLTMFWVDMRTPDITTRPVRLVDGRDELAEIFLDEARVSAEHVVGGVGQGWAIAMHLLQYERGNWAWQRHTSLLAHLSETAAGAGHLGDLTDAAIGTAWLDVLALRAVSGRAVRTTSAGGLLGADSSIAKLLLSTSEKSVIDAAYAVGGPSALIDGSLDPRAGAWFHARSTSVFGGAAEVQRDLVADRVLQLPRART